MRKFLVAAAIVAATSLATSAYADDGRSYILSVRWDGVAQCFWPGNQCIVGPINEY